MIATTRIPDAVKARFPRHVRKRGRRLQRADRVTYDVDATGMIVNWVEDDDGCHYSVGVFHRDEGDFQCDCRSFEHAEVCEHVWAVLTDDGLTSNRGEAGRAPTLGDPLHAAIESAMSSCLEEIEVSDDEPVEAPPNWRSDMNTAINDVKAPNTLAAAPAGTTRPLHFLLEMSSLPHSDTFIIRFGDSRDDVDQGDASAESITLTGVPRIESVDNEEDARLLSALLSTHDGSHYGDHLQLRSGALAFLGPALCATGRFRARRDERIDDVPFTFDDAGPWHVSIEIDEIDEAWRPRFRMTRNGRDFAVSTVDAVFAGGIAIAENTFLLLDTVRAGAVFRWTGKRSDIRIPIDEASHFFERLAFLGLDHHLRLPDGWREMSPASFDDVGRALHIREKESYYGRRKLIGQVEFNYGDGATFDADNKSITYIDVESREVRRRDAIGERRAMDQLVSAGARIDGENLDDFAGGDVAFRRDGFETSVAELIDLGWTVRVDGSRYHTACTSNLQVTSKIDWFDLHGHVVFGNQTVDLTHLMKALDTDTDTIDLGDGSRGILPAAWRGSRDWIRLARTADDGLRFRRSQGLILDLLLAEMPSVDIDEKFEKLRGDLKNFRGIKPIREPAGFVGELRPYQRRGLGWIRFLEKYALGGCLADDMGLGKTVQVLAYLQSRKTRRRRAKTTLVVAPRSVVANWMTEARRFTPDLALLDYRGPERVALRDDLLTHDIVFTTYGVMRRDIEFLKDLEFGTVVLDEAHAIKNEQSQTSKASRLLRGELRLALTGTPIENGLGELWSLFEFVNPGMLGGSAAFRDLTTDDPERLTALAKTIAPFLLRRTKKQVAPDLPEKTEQTITCSLGKEQRRLYDELLESYRASVLDKVDDIGLGRSKMHVLEALLRLRQTACHPGLVDEKFDDVEAAKLEVLLPRLEELVAEGRKALVFSQFTKLLTRVRARLDAAGIVYEYLDGRTRKRAPKVERFQTDPDCSVFLVSLKAGGVGLNLTAAESVFLLDPWWNPAVEAQAVDRAHRIGQTEKVFAYRIVAENTIEEKILELQAQKRDLAESIVRADETVMKSLTRDDIERLLG